MVGKQNLMISGIEEEIEFLIEWKRSNNRRGDMGYTIQIRPRTQSRDLIENSSEEILKFENELLELSRTQTPGERLRKISDIEIRLVCPKCGVPLEGEAASYCDNCQKPDFEAIERSIKIWKKKKPGEVPEWVEDLKRQIDTRLDKIERDMIEVKTILKGIDDRGADLVNKLMDFRKTSYDFQAKVLTKWEILKDSQVEHIDLLRKLMDDYDRAWINRDKGNVDAYRIAIVDLKKTIVDVVGSAPKPEKEKTGLRAKVRKWLPEIGINLVADTIFTIVLWYLGLG